ncbi:MAG TPA: hypothetical protein VKO84_03465 [Gaiellaceae bacterium]|nr:hypothetical protein [Gaiellaceae bacterium]
MRTLPIAPVVVGVAGAESMTTLKKLLRPLHPPEASPADCPQSPGRFVQTPEFGSMVVGTGPVRIGTDGAGNPRQGFHPSGDHGWLALKTHFDETPADDEGPFLVRGERLDRPGVIHIGSTPADRAPLLVLGNMHPTGRGRWQDLPYFTFVRTPGCYGWQIDGLDFSTTVVVRILPTYNP